MFREWAIERAKKDPTDQRERERQGEVLGRCKTRGVRMQGCRDLR